MEPLNMFLKSLKKLEYKEALAYYYKIEDSDKRKLIKAITETVIDENYTGQLRVVDENDNLEIKYLKSLLNGYIFSTKNNYGNVEAFESFLNAYKYAEDSTNNTYKKTSLIAILDLLRYQIFIGSNQYELYLNAFRDIKSDVDDEILLILYEIVFYSKADEDLNHKAELYEAALTRMDSIFSSLPENHPYMPYYYHEKGIEYKFSYQPKLAEKAFEKVEELTEGIKKYRRLYGTNHWQVSDMFLNSKQYEKAYEYLNKSQDVATSLKDSFYDNRLAAKYYRSIEDYQKAFDHLKKSIDNEYVLSSKNYAFMSNQLSRQFKEEAEVKYKTAEKEKQILVEQQRATTNRNWLIAAAVALFFGSGIAVLLQKNTTKKRQLAEQTTLLEQQKVETLLKEQELVSIDAMIAGQEKERQKVANELHDDLGSLMATVKLHFDNVKVDEKDAAMKNAQALLEKAYQKIRGMAHAKNSGVMANHGLLPAVQKMARTINETNALEVTVEDFGLADRMENSLELTIFRILQELMANIIKHAEATKASIQFTQHEDKLNIIVEDNGKGFDMSNIARSSNGMGLVTIEKRIEHLEGTFTVDSIKEKGTSILIDIPI
ncbi:sensor histidine kinase [Maribacter sp. 2308TA10-17]|uniref:sensor histidine kinase n=1 Tax=Maribacter sp. 2308TA10-17 TaxID=3386276 RepID=UPI0039BC2264